MLFAGKKDLIKNSGDATTLNEFEVSSAFQSEYYYLHKFLGANKDLISGEISIRLWAASAKAVTLLTDFNNWSSSAHPMQKVDSEGIWTITIPKHKESFAYQFSITLANGEKKIINDPFAKQSIITDRYSSYFKVDDFVWSDQDWIKTREKSDYKEKPILVKTINLEILKEKNFSNFQNLANYILEKNIQENFSHIELENFFESVIDLSYSNKFSFHKESLLFSTSSAYGELNDFKCFVNFLHSKNIGVILNLPYFSNELSSNYGGYKSLQKPIHENFYLSNIIYWLEELHIDGFNFGPLEQVLLKENSKAHNFLLKANKLIHKRSKGVFSVAQETNGYNRLTRVHKDSLDFDFKLNIVWLKQCLEILKDKPKNIENFAANIMSENFLLGITKSFDTKGITENDFKIIISLSFLLPGKKFFKEDILEEFFDKFQNVKNFYSDISTFYQNEALLYKTDFLVERFCINCIKKDIVVFQRWNYDFSKHLIVIANFANTAKQSFQIDVPKPGFYREVFDSSSYSKQSSLSNDDGVYTYSNQNSLSNKSIVIDVPAKTVLCYKFDS